MGTRFPDQCHFEEPMDFTERLPKDLLEANKDIKESRVIENEVVISKGLHGKSRKPVDLRLTDTQNKWKLLARDKGKQT